MNRDALLKVARACRESPSPDHFTMRRHVHDCGTPACAFGHYAARSDLQSAFRLRNPQVFGVDALGRSLIGASEGVENVEGDEAGYDSSSAREHFDLGVTHLEELFGSNGCDGARTVTEAAQYIEQWVAEHEDASRDCT